MFSTFLADLKSATALKDDKSSKKVRRAWTAACYWSFTRGYEEVRREWPATLEFN
jgi:hypothetical protein